MGQTRGMVGRRYHEERDLAAVTRMWREVGWIDDTDAQADGLRDFLGCGSSLVADVRGQAECLVHRSPGSLRHGTTDLPMCAVTAVTTSHVGRRQGLASALMAETLAAGVEEGAALAGLGMFDQGFYDRFGFGTSTYEHQLTFDPSSLTVDGATRPPVRLSIDDAGEMHALLVRRQRGHGSTVIDPAGLFRAEILWTEKPFALGFRNDDGRLTHFVLGSATAEYGPYEVEWIAHEEPHQLLELLALLRSLGDQVAVMTVAEPPGIQLQDLIDVPLRQRRSARIVGGRTSLHDAHAAMQFRILDLDRCIASLRSTTAPLSFSLRLRDPLDELDGAPWPGIGGAYTVHLADRSTGDASSVDPGLDPGLPVLDATVNAFTRLWLGVRPAGSLTLTDDLSGPQELLDALDDALRMPVPHSGWSF